MTPEQLKALDDLLTMKESLSFMERRFVELLADRRDSPLNADDEDLLATLWSARSKQVNGIRENPFDEDRVKPGPENDPTAD